MSSSYPPEQACEIRLTPLRAFNANLGLIYITLAIIAGVASWFSSRKTGPATFDSNIYRLQGHYDGNLVVPPSGAKSMVTMTPWGSSLALVGAFLVGAMFHMVYAVDFKRLYSITLIDRCNSMRWAQFAIIHTILAMIVAQLLGTTTYDFLMFSLLALPCLGVLGYFGDRSYPCCPWMSYAAIMGTGLILLAYWVPVITNFAYRNEDSGVAAPAYLWIALFSFLVYDLLLFISPMLQAYGKLMYFLVETLHTLFLLFISAIILACVSWALADQHAT